MLTRQYLRCIDIHVVGNFCVQWHLKLPQNKPRGFIVRIQGAVTKRHLGMVKLFGTFLDKLIQFHGISARRLALPCTLG